MADENLNEDVQNEEVKQPAAAEPTAHEQRAIEQGWVPKEEWDGDPDDWRPAKEFLDRGELFKKIEEQKRELKHMKSAMEEFSRHHAKVRDVEYKRALAALKAEKKEALEESDHDAVVEIDERIAEIKEQQRAVPQQTQTESQPDPMFTRWVARNSWYEQDRLMKAAADEVAREVFEASGGAVDKAEMLAAIDKRIRKEFPHKFNNPNRDKANAVEGTSGKGRTANDKEPEMNEVERRIMKTVLASGVISKEKYLEEFKAIKSRGAN